MSIKMPDFMESEFYVSGEIRDRISDDAPDEIKREYEYYCNQGNGTWGPEDYEDDPETVLKYPYPFITWQGTYQNRPEVFKDGVIHLEDFPEYKPYIEKYGLRWDQDPDLMV